MKQTSTPRALRQRAQIARRVLKRTRLLTRPTEAHAMLRANAACLLERYRRTHDFADLEAYIDRVGDGNLFADDIPDDAPLIPDAERHALRQGCARCGRRFPDEEFIEWVDDDGHPTALRHFWCTACRAAYARLSWQDVLREDAWVTRDGHDGDDHDMRRGAQPGRRAARHED